MKLRKLKFTTHTSTTYCLLVTAAVTQMCCPCAQNWNSEVFNFAGFGDIFKEMPNLIRLMFFDQYVVTNCFVKIFNTRSTDLIDDCRPPMMFLIARSCLD